MFALLLQTTMLLLIAIFIIVRGIAGPLTPILIAPLPLEPTTLFTVPGAFAFVALILADPFAELSTAFPRPSTDVLTFVDELVLVLDAGDPDDPLLVLLLEFELVFVLVFVFALMFIFIFKPSLGFKS